MDDYNPIVNLILGILQFLGVLLGIAFSLAITGGILYLIHFFLTLPARRAERARLFLDLLESTIRQGRPLEESLISLSKTRDDSMGLKFHALAAWLESGKPLGEALDKVPYFLPPQVRAMLRAGRKIGNVLKVLPACRQLLKDSVSQMRGALNYVVIITFVITPASVGLYAMLMAFVVPKYLEVAGGIGSNMNLPQGVFLLAFLQANKTAIVVVQLCLLAIVWLAALIYIGGPRLAAWFPVLERLDYRLPWRRRRMQRDFSTMLALLLDAGVPESEALTLAAGGTANSIFRRRAAQAVASLGNGMKLPEAVQTLDDSGEFRWRLRNVVAASGGFLKALTGWHEALDARAFQQEQAVAHGITTGLVIWSGVLVGSLAVAVFTFLVCTINAGVLW